MDYVKKLNRTTSLVGLQMSNQMPTNAIATDLVDLCFRFLDAILAKIQYARLNRA
jgi:hypothetical protein